MRRLIPVLTVTAVIAGTVLSGCEWTSSGDGDSFDSWSDAYNWVDFSGSYRGKNGLLVGPANPSRGGGSGGGEGGNEQRITINAESGGSAPRSQTKIAGSIVHVPILKGSVTITFRGVSTAGTFTDDGSGNLDGTYTIGGPVDPEIGSGSVDYLTGKWNVDLQSPGFLETMVIKYDYVYTVSSSNGVVVKPDENPTTAGGSVYTMQVQQQGNRLTLIDNNGYRYQGTIGGVRTTSGDSTGASSGDVVGQFEVRGGKGGTVTITGTLGGTYVAPAETSNPLGGASTKTAGSFTDRYIEGAWHEDKGVSADVFGISSGAPKTTTTTP